MDFSGIGKLLAPILQKAGNGDVDRSPNTICCNSAEADQIGLRKMGRKQK